jgi:hypothetical protein
LSILKTKHKRPFLKPVLKIGITLVIITRLFSSLPSECHLDEKNPVSSPEFNGLSHREWGDHTQAQAFLIETPNPGQDNSRNQVDLVNDPQMPLAQRMGVHLQSVQAIVASWNAANADRRITWEPMPTVDELLKQPLGRFFND